MGSHHIATGITLYQLPKGCATDVLSSELPKHVSSESGAWQRASALCFTFHRSFPLVFSFLILIFPPSLELEEVVFLFGSVCVD